MKRNELTRLDECGKIILAVRDSLDVLSGRWKLPILISLRFGNKRFKELSKDIGSITDKMLSRELKELELNKLIVRNVNDGFPSAVEYAITEHGLSLKKTIVELEKWGIYHRKVILQK